MKIQNSTANNVSFGIKVPTKQVVDLVSGLRTEGTNDLFLKVTGLSNEKMLTTMSSDTIEFAKSYCAKQITKANPEFQKLVETRDDLMQFIKNAFSQRNGGKLRQLNELFDAREAEKTRLLESLPETLDIKDIKLPL